MRFDLCIMSLLRVTLYNTSAFDMMIDCFVKFDMCF